MMQAMRIAALTRWEWFKLRRRWLPWILLGFVFVVAQLAFWLTAAFTEAVFYRSAAQHFQNGFNFSITLSTIIAVVLAASVTGSEYGWGTLRPALSMGAGRWPFLAAKAAVSLLAVGAILTVVAISVAISSFITEALFEASEAESSGAAATWPGVLAAYFRILYSFLPYILLAIFFVVLGGSNAVGVVVSIVYYFAETFIVRPILVVFDWGGNALAFLISPNISAWQNLDLNPVSEIATIGGLSAMVQGFIVITVYALALGGAAFYLFLRRDIAGARGG